MFKTGTCLVFIIVLETLLLGNICVFHINEYTTCIKMFKQVKMFKTGTCLVFIVVVEFLLL